MTVIDACVAVNSTCSTSGSSVGLATGLTLFFLLLIIVAGVFAYKYRSRITDMLQFVRRRSEKNEDYVETPEADAHQFLNREQSTTQIPIYENLTTQTSGCSRHPVNKSRLSGEPEEDLYLQCDLPHTDDAIYNNDPACELSIVPDCQEEEDVYIVPDS
ncbi:hypothetical protein D5F01_LYC10679 [Larimichthys crocea]|uniref:Uncharacterized protein n=1 Tax=Larimichthys crocea TaxID=215358 RepID=A0A6G0IHT9_LARCR|nr:hypothetical protein D5F01_LYC10679 [Larimichthys crocea]